MTSLDLSDMFYGFMYLVLFCFGLYLLYLLPKGIRNLRTGRREWQRCKRESKETKVNNKFSNQDKGVALAKIRDGQDIDNFIICCLENHEKFNTIVILTGEELIKYIQKRFWEDIIYYTNKDMKVILSGNGQAFLAKGKEELSRIEFMPKPDWLIKPTGNNGNSKYIFEKAGLKP